MASVPTRNTSHETLLRTALHRRGLRYRLHVTTLPGRPDIVLPRSRVVVFVDGDFWHGQSWRARGFSSLEAQFARWHNSAWWLRKVRGNVQRDRRQDRALRDLGWTVLRIRDSAIERDLERCVGRVLKAVQ